MSRLLPTLAVLILAASANAQKVGDMASKESIANSGDKPAEAIRPVPADTSTVPASEIKERLDMDAVQKPPPSAWDRRQQLEREGKAPPMEEEQQGVTAGDLAKTAIALLIVVGLIYLLFRVGLAKFIGVAALKGGKSMKVVERVQLDARHALLIVELDGERRFLLGTGEQGIQMLARLDRDEDIETAAPQASFSDAMAKAVGESEDSNA